jgi:WD40 repeat protein
MAGHTVGRPSQRERRKSALTIIALLLCIGAPNLTRASAPKPNELQWKQSIERPNRGWDYDGKRILGHIGYDICLWDAETGKLLQRMKGHKERIHTVQFSPDGNHALSSSWIGPGETGLISRDTRVILWNLGTGRERDSFPGQVAGEFSPDGRRIVAFSQRPGTGKPSPAMGNATIPLTGEVWQRGPEARFDAAIWDTFTGRQLVKAKLDEYSGPRADTLHFSLDGRSFAHVVFGAFTLYNRSGGVIFDTSDGREIGRVTGEEMRFGGGHRYTSNGALASFEPKRARLIDLKSGRTVRSIPHNLKHIWGTVWTHDGSKFAAIPFGGDQTTICDMESGKKMTGAKTYPKLSPDRAIVSPDNRRLAIESGHNHNGEEDDPEVRLYNMNTGEEIATIKLAKWGHMLGFSPDSKTLLVGGSEFAICDSENGKMIRTLRLLDNLDSHDW